MAKKSTGALDSVTYFKRKLLLNLSRSASGPSDDKEIEEIKRECLEVYEKLEKVDRDRVERYRDLQKEVLA